MSSSLALDFHHEALKFWKMAVEGRIFIDATGPVIPILLVVNEMNLEKKAKVDARL